MESLLFVSSLFVVAGALWHAQLDYHPFPYGDNPMFNLQASEKLIDSIAVDPETHMTTTELIISRGYRAETHLVRTADGYHLQLHRIPNTGPPVFLQHGLLSSSSDFVINFKNQSLGYMLSDVGFDVWMGNFRGNTYSRKHDKLDPDRDGAFWNFSWDEMAIYDLPAMIDYVLAVTDREELLYVGHSMGTTTFFALMASNPQYHSKVKRMVGLGPVALISHMTSPIALLAPFVHEMELVASLFGVHEFLPSGTLLNFLADIICDNPRPRFICENVLFLICGYDEAQLNSTRLGVYVAHDPAGTSTSTVLHYLQMVQSGNFCRYDFGKEENMKRYGQATPPEYELSEVRVPVALIYGDNDRLADPEDVHLLAQSLPNLLVEYRVPYDDWAHLDFIWGVDAEVLQNNYVLKVLLN